MGEEVCYELHSTGILGVGVFGGSEREVSVMGNLIDEVWWNVEKKN
jgi:hypothetical protein